MRHFLEVDDLSQDELWEVLNQAAQPPALGGPSIAAADPTRALPLAGAGVALVFEKASNRTRNSMEMAVAQLGGHPVYIRGEEVGIDTREPAEDVIKTLAGFHALVAARVLDHISLERMAACNVAPVINLLSDQAHPMQALADLLTIIQRFGLTASDPASATPLRVAFVGDANNVWRSLAIGCAMLGIQSMIAAPDNYAPQPADLERISAAGLPALAMNDPIAAVTDAHVVYTDVWTSMGQEGETAQRLADFKPYQVDEKLMSHTHADSIFMHCLPAHRGEEVAAAVVDGERSVVWQQAQNRMHAARGLLAFMASELASDLATG